MREESFRPVRSLGQVASVLIGLSAVMTAVTAMVRWHIAGVASDVDAGEVVPWKFADAVAAGDLVDVVGSVVQIAAGVVFVVWLYRARINSDRVTSTHQHRYTRMWVVIAWLIPVANFLVPYMVVQDVWRGSDRSQPMLGLQQRPQSGLVTAWWLTFVVHQVTGAIGGIMLDDFPTLANVQDSAVWATISALVGIGAVVLAVRLITQLTNIQHAPSVSSSENPAPAA